MSGVKPGVGRPLSALPSLNIFRGKKGKKEKRPLLNESQGRGVFGAAKRTLYFHSSVGYIPPNLFSPGKYSHVRYRPLPWGYLPLHPLWSGHVAGRRPTVKKAHQEAAFCLSCFADFRWFCRPRLRPRHLFERSELWRGLTRRGGFSRGSSPLRRGGFQRQGRQPLPLVGAR